MDAHPLRFLRFTISAFQWFSKGLVRPDPSLCLGFYWLGSSSSPGKSAWDARWRHFSLDGTPLVGGKGAWLIDALVDLHARALSAQFYDLNGEAMAELLVGIRVIACACFCRWVELLMCDFCSLFKKNDLR